MARLSYFKEERLKDINFFRKLTDEQIRRQVKRIVLDIKNCNIEPSDYQYFKNDRILSACLYVSYEEFMKNSIYNESLKLYIDSLVSNDPAIITKKYIAINESNVTAIKASVWREVNRIFMNISYGADPVLETENLKRLDASWFRNL